MLDLRFDRLFILQGRYTLFITNRKFVAFFTSLALAMVAPQSLAEQPGYMNEVTSNMVRNAKCAGLAQLLGNSEAAFDHEWDFFMEAKEKSGIPSNDLELNQAFYSQFGWAQGMAQGLAFAEDVTREHEATVAFKHLQCGEPLEKVAIQIAEKTKFVRDLRKRFSNLILEIEDATKDEVSLYLGFDESSGRRTRKEVLRVDKYRNVYRNRDYHLGTDNWIVVK